MDSKRGLIWSEWDWPFDKGDKPGLLLRYSFTITDLIDWHRSTFYQQNNKLNGKLKSKWHFITKQKKIHQIEIVFYWIDITKLATYGHSMGKNQPFKSVTGLLTLNMSLWLFPPKYLWGYHYRNIVRLVQDWSISSALAVEILQSCSKPSIWDLRRLNSTATRLFNKRKRDAKCGKRFYVMMSLLC